MASKEAQRWAESLASEVPGVPANFVPILANALTQAVEVTWVDIATIIRREYADKIRDIAPEVAELLGYVADDIGQGRWPKEKN